AGDGDVKQGVRAVGRGLGGRQVAGPGPGRPYGVARRESRRRAVVAATGWRGARAGSGAVLVARRGRYGTLAVHARERGAAGAGAAQAAPAPAAAPAQPGASIVLSLSDAGPGTLRDALQQANAGPARRPTLIHFEVRGIIRLARALPRITRPVIIDGTSAPGY